ncbi:hypothetical protein IMSHALPRED_002674 [Imshaugia aleurites]|uniref:Pre-mRNA-splicing factor n=1 Tax=Imshaugia aleurites TaxID=172621 RepID=A0A8H3EZV3_9LECA|nr:hypothetical protein IMSHALPRED_002674 [Imshaugia aleurites]
MPSAEPPSSSPRPSKPISISFGAPKPKGIPTPAPRKRPRSALADNSDGEDEGQPAAQLVSEFDQSGAVVTNGRKEETALLIIPAEKNRDWREESRKKRRKNLLPAEVQAARSGTYEELKAAQVERDEVSKHSGISFVQKNEDGDTTMAEGQKPQQAPAQVAVTPKTEDEEAMEALLGGEKQSTLVLPALEDDRDGYKLEDSDFANEDERFKADVASRPDVATLDNYDVTPVDGYGAAILRGQGWKDGDPIGKRRTQGTTTSKPRIVERRPALLGIGAKEVPTGVGDDEFGAWGKGAKGKRKTDLTYNPVILKNSVTGELLTEEELEKKKLELNGTGEEDWRERRDKNLAIDGRKKEERRERLLIEENSHSENEGIGAGRRSEVVIALPDGAQDRGIEAIIIMARREGNEAPTRCQGEIVAGLMSADIGATDVLLLHLWK